jgi:hypothetical protein
MAKTLSGHLAITPVLAPLYLRSAKIPGRTVSLRTRKCYLPLFLRLGVYLDQVSQLHTTNTWSYAYRAPRMGSGISDHAGYAIDCWSNSIGANAWPSRMPVVEAQIISQILKKFRTKDGRYLFGWGVSADSPGVDYPITYHGKTNDPMHFFIAPNITPKDANEIIARLKIQADGTIGK